MSTAIEKPDETLSTVQPFEFSKEFTKQLKDLGLLKTVEHIKERGYAVMDADVSEEFNNKLREKFWFATDIGNLILRIDSEASIPKGPEDKKGEPETFQWISRSLKPGQVFLDIGANIGVFSLYAALYKDIKVVSLEPSS